MTQFFELFVINYCTNIVKIFECVKRRFREKLLSFLEDFYFASVKNFPRFGDLCFFLSLYIKTIVTFVNCYFVLKAN
jgi:hypothetical protein